MPVLVGLALAVPALAPDPAAAQQARTAPGRESAVPERDFAPLQPEPGDIWAEVRSWRRSQARQGAAPAAGPAAEAAPTRPANGTARTRADGRAERSGAAATAR